MTGKPVAQRITEAKRSVSALNQTRNRPKRIQTVCDVDSQLSARITQHYLSPVSHVTWRGGVLRVVAWATELLSPLLV